MHTLRDLVLLLLFVSSITPAFARDPESLDIVSDQYPRAFFFRGSEGAHSTHLYPSYESWEGVFNRLQGIIGKCLDEECLGREARNPEFFTRFKREHPGQAVLLHFNGNARDPLYETENFFPGHWVYDEATLVLGDVPAESGESVIHVADASRFKINTGRYQNSNDDIALFGITADGKHDWNQCEQVQLIDIDTKANAIRVRRACYGTKPLAFSAKSARAAAHTSEGPWGKNNHLMWYYNYATHCPRDAEGKTCADRIVDDLARWFGPGGKLAAFDGLEFDVLFNRTHGDTDGDTVADDAIIDGINQYGIGVVEFARQLRERLGDNVILQADGALGPSGSASQRAWQIFNGIESEGWPDLRDWEFDDWSGGLNRHFFWRDNARPPVFNYINHKWVQSVPGQPGVTEHPQVPFSRHRLAFAAAQFFDAAICYSYAPKKDPDGKMGIWDELCCGNENKLAWLGRPLAPAVRVATRHEDLLSGSGTGQSLAQRIQGSVETKATRDGVQVTAAKANEADIEFHVGNVPTSGSDLFVSVKMKAASMNDYPSEMARFAQVGVSGGMMDLLAKEPIETGMKIRSELQEQPLDRQTGAGVSLRKAELDGQSMPAVFTHPPYRGAKGYTYWTQEATIPPHSELHFSIGMGELSPQRSDGVMFQVFAAEVQPSGLGEYVPLFEATTNTHQWLPQSVSLQSLGGKRVRFKFVADCGPKDNTTTDQAYWGGVRIVKENTHRNNVTPFAQAMTWVNEKTFESGFYFRDIRSAEVDLSFTVESSEPVWIESITAHARPDVIYRIFEHGIVLANPSRNPYTFDLDAISPDKSYRRLQGSANQDKETNNGQPVAGRVTLGERDALFLQLN
ncbi:hypothetical protein [Novipirellula artificiosorum]|uniref:Uncharacterized protein n=1 Tax=Novipirellula artificiosorum TaxID=2528016 RepID=A0A5C6D814_9BACT|nr:hypothetical protein [Novipirellula artificiosorum]TWU31376.1 hypothetical protein Poly41_62450 [Novipirellula artificiosorum]